MVDAEWDAPTGRQTRSIDGPDAARELCAQIEAAGADRVLVSFTNTGGAFFASGSARPTPVPPTGTRLTLPTSKAAEHSARASGR